MLRMRQRVSFVNSSNPGRYGSTSRSSPHLSWRFQSFPTKTLSFTFLMVYKGLGLRRREKNAQPKVDAARKPPTGKDKNLKTSYKSGGCFIYDGPHQARDFSKKASLNGMSAHEDEERSMAGHRVSDKDPEIQQGKNGTAECVMKKAYNRWKQPSTVLRFMLLLIPLGINATKGSGTIKAVNSPAKAIHTKEWNKRRQGEDEGNGKGTLIFSVVPRMDSSK
ncbi:hypothetical protein Tco_0845414 [Tanacetum coccineum]